MTIAVRSADGAIQTFADSPSFMAWFTSTPHRGVLDVLNADPISDEGVAALRNRPATSSSGVRTRGEGK